MLTNYTFIMLLIVLSWLLVFGYYVVTSRKQKKLETDIEKIQQMLPPEQNGEDA